MPESLRVRKSCLAVALTLTTFLVACLGACDRKEQSAGQTEKGSAEEARATGSIAWRLLFTNVSGFHLLPLQSDMQKLRLISPFDVILKIDDVPLRGLSIDEASRLLNGSAGSRIKVTKLDDLGYVLNIVFERLNLDEGGFLESKGGLFFEQGVRLLESGAGRPGELVPTAKACASSGRYMLAKSLLLRATDEPVVNRNVLSALEIFRNAADFQSVDDLVNRIIGSKKSASSLSVDPEKANSFFEFLIDSGRYDAALMWAGKLEKSYDNDLDFLTRYVQLLDRVKKGDEAKMVLGRVSSIVKTARDDPNQAALVASLYARHDQEEKAINLYRSVLERLKNEQSSRRKGVVSSQLLASNCIALARLYAENSQFDKAIKVLRDGSATTRKGRSEFDLDVLEQISNSGLRCSDIEIYLADVLKKAGDNESAEKQYQEAIKRIERALGKQSPYLQRPLGGAESPGARAESLRDLPPPENTRISDPYVSVCERARGAVKKGEFDRARDELQKLKYKRDSSLSWMKDPYAIPQLVNIALAYHRATKPNQADELLAYAQKQISSHVLPAPYLLDVLLERLAIDPDQAKLWSQVEGTLQSIKEASDRSRRSTYRSTAQTRSDMMRQLAQSYRDRPEVCKMILDRAMKLATQDKNAGSIYLIELDRKLLDLPDDPMKIKFPDVNVVASSPDVVASSGQKFVRISQSLIEQGKIGQAETLLKKLIAEFPATKATSNTLRISTPQIFQIRLAVIYADRKQYKKAVQLYDDAGERQRSRLSSGEAAACADALASVGRSRDAVRLYESVLRSDSNTRMLQILKNLVRAASKDKRLLRREYIQYGIQLAELLQSRGNKPEADRLLHSVEGTIVSMANTMEWRQGISFARTEASSGRVRPGCQTARAIAMGLEKSSSAETIEAWLEVARMQYHFGRAEQARKTVEHALSLDDKFKRAWIAGQARRPDLRSPFVTELVKSRRRGIAELLVRGNLEALEKFAPDNKKLRKRVLSDLDVVKKRAKHHVEQKDVASFLKEFRQMRAFAFDGSSRKFFRNNLHQHLRAFESAGSPDRAMETLKSILSIQTEYLGQDNPMIAQTLVDIGRMLVRMDRGYEARRRFKRALEIYQACEGPYSYSVVALRGEFSALLRELGKGPEAESVGTIKVTPSTSERRKEIRDLMNSAGPKRGEDAEAKLNKAYKLAKDEFKYGTSITTTLNKLYELFYWNESFDKAKEVFRYKLGVLERFDSKYSREYQVCLEKLIELSIKTGDRKATNNFLSIAEQTGPVRGMGARDFVRHNLFLAESYLDLDDGVRAKQAATRAYELLSRDDSLKVRYADRFSKIEKAVKIQIQ